MKYDLAAIERAAREHAQTREHPWLGGAGHSKDGRISCCLVPAQARSASWNGVRFRATWYVDGKKVSRAKADELAAQDNTAP